MKRNNDFEFQVWFAERGGSDWEFEYIIAENVREAISIFRGYVPRDKYEITQVNRVMRGDWSKF